MIDKLIAKLRARASSAEIAGNQHPKFIEGLRCAANVAEKMALKELPRIIAEAKAEPNELAESWARDAYEYEGQDGPAAV